MQTKQKPWQEYWKSGSYDTFGHQYGEGNPISDAISAQLRSLTFHQSNIQGLLDLGCGKGEHFPWLRTVLPHQNSHQCPLIGIDFATGPVQIDANTQILRDDFETLQALSKVAQPINVVYAMFAAEYADFPKLLGALSKQIERNADCVFVMHRPDSEISRKSRFTLEFYTLLFDPSMLEAIEQLQQPGALNSFEQKVIAQLKGIAGSGRQELMFDVQTVGQRLMSVFKGRQSTGDSATVTALLGYFDSLLWHRSRLEQQLDSAANAQCFEGALDAQGGRLIADKLLNTKHGAVGRLVHFTLAV